MGHCGYYRHFIHMYVVIAKLLKENFQYIDQCEELFEKLKQALVSIPMFTPILKSLNQNKIFHVHVDAFAYTIGCIVAQLRDGIVDFSISYLSQWLNSTKKNYTIIEQEGLEMTFAMKKFRYYLLKNKFVLFMNTKICYIQSINDATLEKQYGGFSSYQN